MAEYYEKQTAESETQASFHRQLAETYFEFRNSYKISTVSHCDSATDNYVRIVAEDFALAEQHRKLAQASKCLPQIRALGFSAHLEAQST